MIWRVWKGLITGVRVKDERKKVGLFTDGAQEEMKLRISLKTKRRKLRLQKTRLRKFSLTFTIVEMKIVQEKHF